MKKAKAGKKSIVKRPWLWVIICLICVGAAMGSEDDNKSGDEKISDSPNSVTVSSNTPDRSTPDTTTPVPDQSENESSDIPAQTQTSEPVSQESNNSESSNKPEPDSASEPDNKEDNDSEQEPPPQQPSSEDSDNNFNTYDNEEQQKTENTWVLNTNTMKIHYPSCNQVKKIAPQNYSTSNLAESDLIAQGYTTCGVCH
ncbi:MAG: hypothetical protein HDT20_03995 [Oscillibacter sp.]|nr:hypothetical protein [Oscillibacter sp.]